MPKRKFPSAGQDNMEQLLQNDDLCKVNSKCFNMNQENCIEESPERSSDCWLLLLPNEILEHICSFLTPKSILAVTELNYERMTDSTLNLKIADFTSCNNVLPDEIGQFFTPIRVQHIKEINFNYVFFVRTSDLERVIIKCKHLTTLSIIGCGLTLTNVCRILCQCKKLNELYWDVCINGPTKSSEMEFPALQLKKLYLYLNDLKDLDAAIYLINLCQSVPEICLNFTPLTSTLPLKTNKTFLSYKLHTNPNCRLIIVLNDWYNCLDRDYIDCITSKVKCSCPDTEIDLPVTMTTPYLQLKTNSDDFSLLTSIGDKSIQELVLCCTDKRFLLENIDAIKRVLKKDTTYLAVIESLPSFKYFNREKEYSPEVDTVCMKLLSNYCNIQELILSELHITEPFDFEALHKLKGLKTLSLPACAFYTHPWHCEMLKKPLPKDCFELMVENCKEVQHFSLTGCHRPCSDGPKDKDISAICHWSKLRTLSLIKISTLQFCHFLRNLPECCVNLRSLEIAYIAGIRSQVYHYIPSVMHVLLNSPELVFLSVTLDSLSIRSERFWYAISSAKNLQGLCVATFAPFEIQAKPIVDAIDKMPFLHLFHLRCPKANENIKIRVQRIMKRHGVKQPKVEVTYKCHVEPLDDFCENHHFFDRF